MFLWCLVWVLLKLYVYARVYWQIASMENVLLTVYFTKLCCHIVADGLFAYKFLPLVFAYLGVPWCIKGCCHNEIVW